MKMMMKADMQDLLEGGRPTEQPDDSNPLLMGSLTSEQKKVEEKSFFVVCDAFLTWKRRGLLA